MMSYVVRRNFFSKTAASSFRFSSSTSNPSRRPSRIETPPLSAGEQAIYDKLTAHFSPSKLQVQDISGGCGTFYAIGITSDAFKDLPLVKQHRLVNSSLKAEIEGIHGLQIKTSAE